MLSIFSYACWPFVYLLWRTTEALCPFLNQVGFCCYCWGEGVFLYILDIYPCQKISRQLYWIWIFYWARSKLLKNRETSEACFHQLQLSLWSMNEEYLVFSCDWFLEIHISFHCISLLIVGNWLGSHKITLTWRMLKLCLRSGSVFWENQDTYMWLWALGLWLYSNCGLCFGLL